MRPALLTSEPGDVQHGSGTAVAVANLGEALALNGVQLSIVRGRAHPLGHTLARARFNRAGNPARGMYDCILGVGGDGHLIAAQDRTPFIALPKALYLLVRPHEGLATRAMLGRHAALEARASRAADLVVVPSRFAAAVVHRSFDVPWSRIEVIPEPFPAARWRSTLTPAARQGRRVLIVAHLYRRKRVLDVIAAWPRVLRAHPDAELDIAGDGPELASVRRAASGLGGVRVLGHVSPDRLRALYARADVAVSASAHETFGYAVLEALAAGLPVVIAAAPAVVELCDGAVAEQVDIGDVAALAGAIVTSLDASVAAAAAAVNPGVAGRCDPRRIGAAYIQAIDRIRGGSSAPRRR